jgi:hypothetical protein
MNRDQKRPGPPALVVSADRVSLALAIAGGLACAALALTVGLSIILRVFGIALAATLDLNRRYGCHR